MILLAVLLVCASSQRTFTVLRGILCRAHKVCHVVRTHPTGLHQDVPQELQGTLNTKHCTGCCHGSTSPFKDEEQRSINDDAWKWSAAGRFKGMAGQGCACGEAASPAGWAEAIASNPRLMMKSIHVCTALTCHYTSFDPIRCERCCGIGHRATLQRADGADT